MKLVLLKSKISKEFPLEEGSNLIGRWDPDDGAFPEIDLDDVDDNARVSRKHAVVEVKGSVAVVEDLGSANGTSVNTDEKLAVGQKVTLKDGDEILFGGVLLQFKTK